MAAARRSRVSSAVERLSHYAFTLLQCDDKIVILAQCRRHFRFVSLCTESRLDRALQRKKESMAQSHISRCKAQHAVPSKGRLPSVVSLPSPSPPPNIFCSDLLLRD